METFTESWGVKGEMSDTKRRKRKKLATISDVAQKAGTSIATVSYVLNDSKERYIRPELRQRVLDAAAELNYVKSGLASSLKGKERGIIAVLTPQFENQFFVKVFMAIEKIANKHGYVLSTCNTFDDPEHERVVLERMIRLRADGYIVIPTTGGAENTRYLREMNLPFVAVERPLDGVDKHSYDLVCSDNFDAGYALTTHLIKMGHRNIAFIYWDTAVSNLYHRVEGYKKALEDNGLPFQPELLLSGNITQEDGARLTYQMLERKNVTAIAYGQYMQAEGGIKALRQHGLKIPTDISVALIGSPAWAQMNDTKITCVNQPAAEMGEEAAKVLLSRIQDTGKGHDYIYRQLPVKLVKGESVKDLR